LFGSLEGRGGEGRVLWVVNIGENGKIFQKNLKEFFLENGNLMLMIKNIITT